MKKEELWDGGYGYYTPFLYFVRFILIGYHNTGISLLSIF